MKLCLRKDSEKFNESEHKRTKYLKLCCVAISLSDLLNKLYVRNITKINNKSKLY